MEMGDGEFGVVCGSTVGARGVVGGTCQYTGGAIRNSLTGKGVVALNDMFGYSSQLHRHRNNFKAQRASANVVCLCLRKVRTQHVITCDQRHDNVRVQVFSKSSTNAPFLF